MERNKYVPDSQTRHTVTFSVSEVEEILHQAAKAAGKGLPARPTYIRFPNREDTGSARKVVIGTCIKEGG